MSFDILVHYGLQLLSVSILGFQPIFLELPDSVACLRWLLPTLGLIIFLLYYTVNLADRRAGRKYEQYILAYI